MAVGQCRTTDDSPKRGHAAADGRDDEDG